MTRTDEVAFFLINKLRSNRLGCLNALREATPEEIQDASKALAGYSNSDDTIEVTIFGNAGKALKVIEARIGTVIKRFSLTKEEFRRLHQDISLD